MKIKNKHVIIFDGLCNFCNGSVNFIIARDSNAIFLFTPVQSQTAKSLMSKHKISDIGNDTFILIKHKIHFLRTDAALEIAKDLDGYWYLFRIFKILPKSFRDWFYNIFAKYRYKMFGKKDTCMIPTDNIKSRFI